MPVHAEVTPVEINAPPERVREVLLDFANMPTWHSGHFKSIKVQSGKNPKDLVAGDKLDVSLSSLPLNFSPVIVENSPSKFRWRGSMPGVFTGDHVFEFAPSEAIPGGTKFIHYEGFSGMLSFTMKPEKKSGQQNLDGFNALNNDLKKKVEGSA